MGISIAGIDPSITGTAAVRFDLTDDFDMVSSSHIAFSSVKKHQDLGNVVYSKKDMFDSDMERFKYTQMTLMSFLHGVDYISMEGYAMGVSGNKGLIFNIAEFCGTLKMRLFESGKKLQIYTPSTIKLYAGGPGRGNANKIHMKQFFDELTHENKPDLKGYPEVTKPSGNGPTSDIIDAFFICDMLWLELLLRNNRHSLDDCTEAEKAVFGVSKKYPEDPLGRDFIKEKLYDL